MSILAYFYVLYDYEMTSGQIQITTGFFQNKFHDDNVENILPFEGPLKKLNTPITLLLRFL